MGEKRSGGNVRDAPSSFVGRENDLEAVVALVREGARIVTILGPGGIGKTRLALQAAERLAPTYSSHEGGGVWFVDLTLAETLGEATGAVARVLDPHARGDVVANVGDALERQGRTLLVLDNFEQLAKGCAQMVEEWVRAAPLVQVLITSRVALDLTSEARWPLGALPEEDAVSLFLSRATQVRPDALRGAPRELVRDIVQAVDRIPLAIELAASRVAILSPKTLKERLERPLGLLVKSGDDSRHASMRRTIHDSVKLLGPSERGALLVCAVFRGGFDLPAADALLEGKDVLGLLLALTRASLLRSLSREDGDVRFSFFETIREVASELAREGGTSEGARRAHSRYFGERALRLLCAGSVETDGSPSGDLLREEEDNLALAHETAVDDGEGERALTLGLALDVLLSPRGESPRRIRVLTRSIEIGKGHPLVAKAFVLRGMAHRDLGEVARARKDLEHGLALARGSQLPEVAALAQLRLGEIVEVSGDTRSAHACFSDALSLLSLAREGPERTLREAEAFLRRGHTLRREGRLREAEDAVLHAKARYEELSHDEGLAAALYEAAVVAMFLADSDRALRLFDEGLAIAHRADVRVIKGALTTARGSLLQELGRSEEAKEHHARAAQIFHDLGARYREMSALYYLATAFLDARKPEEAAKVLVLAERRGRDTDAPRYTALIEGARAICDALTGAPERAREALARARTALSRTNGEPAVEAALAIHELTLSAIGGEAGDVAVASALAEAHPSDDSRFALRTRVSATHPAAVREGALSVARDGSRFKIPHGREWVDISKRAPLRAIVRLLAERRVDNVGEAVAAHEVILAAWPGQKIRAESALNRLYVALATLRKLGFRGLLLTRGGGYLLSPAVSVVFEA